VGECVSVEIGRQRAAPPRQKEENDLDEGRLQSAAMGPSRKRVKSSDVFCQGARAIMAKEVEGREERNQKDAESMGSHPAGEDKEGGRDPPNGSPCQRTNPPRE